MTQPPVLLVKKKRKKVGLKLFNEEVKIPIRLIYKWAIKARNKIKKLLLKKCGLFCSLADADADAEVTFIPK